MKRKAIILASLCLLPFFLQAQLGKVSVKRISASVGSNWNHTFQMGQIEPAPLGGIYDRYCGTDGYHIYAQTQYPGTSSYAYPTNFISGKTSATSLRLATSLSVEKFSKWEVNLGLMAQSQRFLRPAPVGYNNYHGYNDLSYRSYQPVDCGDVGYAQPTRAIGLDVSVLRILSFWNRFEAYGGLGTMTSLEWTDGFSRRELSSDPVTLHETSIVSRSSSSSVQQQVFVRTGLRVNVWSGLEIGVDGRVGPHMGRSIFPRMARRGAFSGFATVAWTFDNKREL
ncbi:MAG: hypothetical protein AAF587_02915 [Bacteroidota bacterium]